MSETIMSYWNSFMAWCSGMYAQAMVYINQFFDFLHTQPWANRSVLISGVICLVIYWKVKRLVKLLVFACVLFGLYFIGRFYGVI